MWGVIEISKRFPLNLGMRLPIQNELQNSIGKKVGGFDRIVLLEANSSLTLLNILLLLNLSKSSGQHNWRTGDRIC